MPSKYQTANETLNVEDNIEQIEKNYRLSNDNYFHFHTNDEGYYYAIYDSKGTEIDGGLLEYSEIDNKKQTLYDIRKRLAEFTDIAELSDKNLEEVSQAFIDNLEQELESTKNKKQIKRKHVR